VKGFIAALSLVSGVLSSTLAGAPLFSQTPPAAPPPPVTTPGDGSSPESAALYQFTLAKLLAVEGSVPEALSAYEEAERLAPDSPYVRIEHAQLLARVGEYSRAPGARQEYLRRAAAKINEARGMAPENLDVLRTVGSIHLDLALQDPAAMATALAALEEVLRRDPADVPAALNLGQVYIEQRQPEKAAVVLRELITRVPQQRVAYALLIEALLRAEKGGEAETALAEILSFDAGSIESRLTLVDLQSRRGDHEAALKTLRASPEEVRGDPRVQRKLAWELYLSGEIQESLATVDRLLAGDRPGAAGAPGPGGPEPAADPSSDPDAPSMRLLKGLLLSAEGRNAEALGLLREIQQSQPGNVPLALTVGRLLQRTGKVEEATALLSPIAVELAGQGKSAEEREVRLELAQIQIEGKDWSGTSRTVAPLLAVTGDEPTRLQAVLLHAHALSEEKRYDEALAALEAGGQTPAVESRRAEVLVRAGRAREGEERLATLAGSGDTTSILAAAQSWQRLERYDASIPVLERLVSRQPESAVAHFLLGAGYERTGKRKEAVASFRRVLEIDPDFHAALNYLGYTFAEAGENLDEALRLVRRAVALDPDNGSYVDSLGWTYHQLGRHEQAREALERAARLEPADATLQEHLGDVYVALGQNDRALEAYRRALELGDDDEGNADDADTLEKVRRKLDSLERSRNPSRP
jgi:tetratricopeptide (TPR) repeat protein